MKKVLYLVMLTYTFSVYSQNKNAENKIKNTISTFFEGLHNGDTAMVNSILNNELVLQTVFINSEGKSVLKKESKASFLNTLSQKKPKDIWFEKLLGFTIHIDYNLATVWTPYEFYFNQVFSHCGVNSFQLFFNSTKWEIISIVDTRRKQDCKKE